MENKFKIHELKISSQYYDDVVSGKKRFELRKDDRNYKVGDLIQFFEYDNKKFTGRSSNFFPIYYILRNCSQYGLMDGYCILGI